MSTRPSSSNERSHLIDALRAAERLARRGDPAIAEQAYRDLLADLRLLPHTPYDVYARARNGLGALLSARGRRAEAVEVHEKTLSMLDGLRLDYTGRDQLRTALEAARTLVLLSGERFRMGDKADANALADRAVREILCQVTTRWELHNPTSESLAATLSEMATELCSQGRAEQAERMLRMELVERERLEASVRVSSRTRIRLAHCLMQQNKLGEAERTFRSALEQREAAGLPPDAITKARCWLASCVLAAGRPEEAEQILLEGLRGLRALGDEPRSRAALRYTLAKVNLEQGRDAEAKEMLLRGLEDLEGAGVDADSAALHRIGLAHILHAEGQASAAQATLLQALATPKALHPQTRQLVRDHLLALRNEPTSAGNSMGGNPRTTLYGLDRLEGASAP